MDDTQTLGVSAPPAGEIPQALTDVAQRLASGIQVTSGEVTPEVMAKLQRVGATAADVGRVALETVDQVEAKVQAATRICRNVLAEYSKALGASWETLLAPMGDQAETLMAATVRLALRDADIDADQLARYLSTMLQGLGKRELPQLKLMPQHLAAGFHIIRGICSEILRSN